VNLNVSEHSAVAASRTVAFVLDPRIGIALKRLATRMPVWLVASSENLRAIEKVEGCPRVRCDVTPVYVNGNGAEEWLVNHVDTVDQHHNQFSQDPPYDTLEVVGCVLTERVRDTLSGLGFRNFASRKGGFVASKRAR